MGDRTKIRVEPFLVGQGLRVDLNDPKGNVLDGTMMSEINALLDELRSEKDLKLICFCGAGKHFSFGASVEEHVGERAAAMLEVFHGMFLRMIDLAVPTVAAVSGRCLGGGMELAAFCNWVVAHPEAKLGQPEIQLAVLPPVASLILPFKVGQSRADEINLTGRLIDAAEAHAMGLVDQVDEDPVGRVEKWAAEHIVNKSASALRCAVRASRWRYNQVFRAEIKAMERHYLDELMATKDANEGLEAFLEKRKPQWSNE
jgi:cyclohexa-1,5-dienecarbonyl-CoA hydratase